MTVRWRPPTHFVDDWLYYHTSWGYTVNGRRQYDMCIIGVGDVFYISPDRIDVRRDVDIGPYATLEQAKAAAEMLVEMGEEPT